MKFDTYRIKLTLSIVPASFETIFYSYYKIFIRYLAVPYLDLSVDVSVFPVTRFISFFVCCHNTEPKFIVVVNGKWVVPSFVGVNGHSCPFTYKKDWKLSKMP